MLEKHGTLGTLPNELVRLVIERFEGLDDKKKEVNDSYLKNITKLCNI